MLMLASLQLIKFNTTVYFITIDSILKANVQNNEETWIKIHGITDSLQNANCIHWLSLTIV